MRTLLVLAVLCLAVAPAATASATDATPSACREGILLDFGLVAVGLHASCIPYLEYRPICPPDGCIPP